MTRRDYSLLLSIAVSLMLLFAAIPAIPVIAGGDGSRPLVIGHRGASGYLPDHTLESYALAIELGADYIEPDLVMTKDGHLVARHEPNLVATTDVSTRVEFASRRRTALVDGVAEEGWFASDFTLAEIRTLRAVQPLAERPSLFNGQFTIPTFAEVIDLAQRKSREKHRTIGVYPETKWDPRDAPVFIQSFEQWNLKALRRMTRVRLVQLMDANDVLADGTLDFTAPFDRPYDWTVSGDPALLARRFDFFTTAAGLREVKTYADGIGPWKRYIVSTAAVDLDGDGLVGDENGDGVIDEADRATLPPTDLIRRAHAHGLVVHTWTFRNERRRLAATYAGDPIREYLQFFALGIVGVFAAACLVDRRAC